MSGDDGDLQRGVAWPDPRFTDNGNGTVTDNLTKLIWDKDANRFSGMDLTWSQALANCNQLADGATGLTDGSIEGEWRLANLNEYESLLHIGVGDPAIPDSRGTGKWTEGDPFFGVDQGWPESTSLESYAVYWTSTHATESGETLKMQINLGSGFLYRNTGDPYAYLHGWCVRSQGGTQH